MTAVRLSCSSGVCDLTWTALSDACIHFCFNDRLWCRRSRNGECLGRLWMSCWGMWKAMQDWSGAGWVTEPWLGCLCQDFWNYLIRSHIYSVCVFFPSARKLWAHYNLIWGGFETWNVVVGLPLVLQQTLQASIQLIIQTGLSVFFREYEGVWRRHSALKVICLLSK